MSRLARTPAVLVALAIALARNAVALPAHPSTPEAAARAAVSSRAGEARVVRTNAAGRYAAVLLGGAMMEGSPLDAPILVERFAFGWQALDVLNDRCRLDDHELTANERAALMAGMPAPRAASTCDGIRDRGRVADVEAVRAISRETLVPWVVVSGDFALASWYGGENLYRRRGAAWSRVAGGGGAMSASELGAAGVPRSSWCVLVPRDETYCKPR